MARTSARDRSWPQAPDPLPFPVVDNHTHLDALLDLDDLPDGVAAVTIEEHLERARAVGVPRAIQVGCDLPAVRWTDDAVRRYPGLVGAVAIHPNEATLHAGVTETTPDGLTARFAPHHEVDLDAAIAEVEAVARGNDRIRAIGETGLDHFRAGERGRAVQMDAFRAHIALAKELGLVMQIHDRDAHAEVIEVLLRDGAPERTVFHCFSGDDEMARACADRGWYLSFAGPVTYRSNESLRAALRAVPLSRVLVETDAPYLTPHPFRGRPNAPYLVPVTVRSMAQTVGLGLESLCRTLAATTESVYGRW
jgi:TatD DNase family protein